MSASPTLPQVQSALPWGMGSVKGRRTHTFMTYCSNTFFVPQ